jgi:hypothetical protein
MVPSKNRNYQIVNLPAKTCVILGSVPQGKAKQTKPLFSNNSK